MDPKRPKHSQNARGFSMFELLIVLAIGTIIATVLITIVNPIQIGADARNRRRESDINSILNLVYRNIADNGGTFNCAGALPTSTQNMASSSYNISGCLVPKYISILPYDPRASSARYSSVTNYNLQYSITVSSTTGRVTVSAPQAELGKVISITR